MSTRQIASSTLWQLMSQLTMAALSILTVKFVAIGLTKELAGNYNSAYSFLQLFGILADFGLYAIAVREVSRSDEKEEVLGALFILRAIILVLSLGVALFFVWIVPSWRGTPLPLSVTIAAFVPFFTLLAGMIRTIFQIQYKMHFVFISEVIQRIITTALIGSVIFLGVRGTDDRTILYLFLAMGGIGAFILFLLSLLFGLRLMRVRLRWNVRLLKKLLSHAMPYGIAFLCMALYRYMDITLIALLRQDFEIQNAYYGFVVRMVDMGFLLPTFLLNSTLPLLSERDGRGEDTSGLLGKTFLIVLMIGMIAALFSYFWPHALVELLTTSSYLATAEHPGSDSALQMLSFPLLLNGIVLFSFYVLLNRLVWKKLVVALGIASVLALGLNLWLIPIYGFMGATYTSIIIHLFLALALFPQSQAVMKMRLPKNGLIRLLIFGVLLGGFLHLAAPFLTGELRTIIGLGVASIVMGLLILVTGLYKSVWTR